MVFLTWLKIMHEPSKLNIFNGFHEYDMMKKGFLLTICDGASYWLASFYDENQKQHRKITTRHEIRLDIHK